MKNGPEVVANFADHPLSITIISQIRFNIAKIDGIGKQNAFPVNTIINTILCYYEKYGIIGNDLSSKNENLALANMYI